MFICNCLNFDRIISKVAEYGINNTVYALKFLV